MQVMLLSENDVQNLVERIATISHPEKIILFGSYANGTASESSDLDILVIANSSLSPYKRSAPLRRELRGVGVPLDLFVYTPQEIENWKSERMAFTTKILKNGKIVWSKPG